MSRIKNLLSFKNMRLGIKLGMGFGVMTLIVIALGVASLYSANIVSNSATRIKTMASEMETLSHVADNMTSATRAHKDWVGKVNSCVYDNADSIDVTMDGHVCGLGHFLYEKQEDGSTGLEQLAGLSPELAAKLEDMKEEHLQLHETAKKMNDIWMPTHDGLVIELKDHLDEHRVWASKVANAIMAGEECHVQADPAKCGFGHFLASGESKDLEKQWPEYAELMGDVRKSHDALHISLKAINNVDLDSDNAFEQRRKIYEEESLPQLEAVVETFAKIQALEQQRSDSQREVSAILKNESLPLADKVVAALDAVNAGVDGRTAELEAEQHSLLGEQRDAIALQTTVIWCAMLVGSAVAVILAVLLIRGITGPLARAVDVANAMAQGDLTQRVNSQARDEVGQLADALDQSAENLAGMLGKVKNSAEAMAGSSEELSATSNELATGADEMTAQSGNVAGATEQMSTNINTMASGAEEMSVNVQGVSSTAEQMSQNMNAIASAIEEMTAAINDIGKNAREGSKISAEAMEKSQSATETMGVLGDAASQIGEVTEVIKRIAEQTNLLALNATIEAASAGDAGKGFAVVANEIKELANQSAQAAEDIAKRIAGVQTNTEEAVSVIADVSDVIGTINQSVEVITNAVDEQMKTANEISSNVQQANSGAANIASSVAEVAKGTNDVSKNAGEAARGANDVASNIQGVNQAATNAAAGAQQVNTSAEDLAKIANELQAMVENFKVESRRGAGETSRRTETEALGATV